MFKSFNNENKRERSLDNTEEISDSKLNTIFWYLSSSEYPKYMSAVVEILKYVKKGYFDQFSNDNCIRNLYRFFPIRSKDKKIDTKIVLLHIDPMLRCLYYLTDSKNPQYCHVWELINQYIFILFTDRDISGHSFKIICKIISNFLNEANEEELYQFKVNYFDFISEKLNKNIEGLLSMQENDEVNDSGYICQGCLRIFAALCNQQEAYEKNEPGFINDCCIQPFFNDLLYRNKYMKRAIIMYVYYIVNWSPDIVIFGIADKKFMEFFYSLILNKDKKKNYLSFYSILILLSFSKLHNEEVASNLFIYSPFDVDISQLPKQSRTLYLSFIYHIAITKETYAQEFIKSVSLLSIIDQESDDIIKVYDINNFKFMKYISTLYAKFASIREDIISITSEYNPFYFFVSFLVQIEDPKLINIGVSCINDLVLKIQTGSELGQFLKEKFNNRSDEINDNLEYLNTLCDDELNSKENEENHDYIEAFAGISALLQSLSELAQDH